MPLELTRIVDLTTDGERALFIGASPTRSPSIVAADLADRRDRGAQRRRRGGRRRRLRLRPAAARVPDHRRQDRARALLSAAPPGLQRARRTSARRCWCASTAARRPTSPRRSRPEIQFFTSRGFAVVDVNYGGSTGYGREYRDRLHGQWGVVDTDDAVNAARALAAAGEVDGARMAITGGSAGGWTVLCALAFYPDVFAAGADYYGVSDLSGFVDDTHKFESRYNDWLVGPWPEAEELWRERSPVNHADKIRAPVIILQGLEDKVVPPSQSEHRRQGARGQRHPVRVPRVRGRAARVPQGRTAAARRRGRAVLLRPGLRFRARRRDRAGRDHQGDGS